MQLALNKWQVNGKGPEEGSYIGKEQNQRHENKHDRMIGQKKSTFEGKILERERGKMIERCAGMALRKNHIFC